ncbi:MAG TPA: HAD family hydrolase [Peptococcaceae bacterium]|nr:HAD family hydrolase [Peptococcaceae bacterium]
MATQQIIFFDCMETLIDMEEIPGVREYALWAYAGSGVETYWESFQEYLDHYIAVRKELQDSPPFYKEYELKERLSLVVERTEAKRGKQNNSRDFRTAEIVHSLYSTFWPKYKAKCFASGEVYAALSFLTRQGFTLGVVSNFLVKGGIQEILEEQGIANYFDFIVASADVGWKKPHPAIYQMALAKAGVNAQEVIFIGDDYENDYLTPQKLGFTTLLFDKNNAYPHLERRFTGFAELPDLLQQI